MVNAAHMLRRTSSYIYIYSLKNKESGSLSVTSSSVSMTPASLLRRCTDHLPTLGVATCSMGGGTTSCSGAAQAGGAAAAVEATAAAAAAAARSPSGSTASHPKQAGAASRTRRSIATGHSPVGRDMATLLATWATTQTLPSTPSGHLCTPPLSRGIAAFLTVPHLHD